MIIENTKDLHHEICTYVTFKFMFLILNVCFNMFQECENFSYTLSYNETKYLALN